MNLRNFLLMAICLVLGGLAVWKMEAEAPNRMNTAAGEALLPGVKPDDFSKVSVVRPGDSYSMERKASGGWELRRPEGALVDKNKAADLLKNIGALKAQNSIERAEVEADQAIYGLQPPELILTVEGAFGKKTFSFGKKVSVSGRRYLQSEGEGRLFLVDDQAFSLLNVGEEDVRDRRPIKFERGKVKEFFVSRGGENRLKFIRGEKWTVQSPAGEFPVDGEFVESKLDELLKVKVKRFVDEPGTNYSIYGLTLPKVIIRVRTSADEGDTSGDVTVQAGEGVSVGEGSDIETGRLEPVKGYYIKVAGQPFIYEISNPFYSDLLQSPEYFRPRSPLSFLRGKAIGRIEAEVSGKPAFALVPEAGGWRLEIAGQPPLAAAPERVQGWLEEAAQLRVISYPGSDDDGARQTGLQQPAAQFKIFVKDRPAPVLLMLGAQVESRGKEPSESDDRPHWVAVAQEDGALLPAIIRGGSYSGLQRSGEYFIKER